MTKANLYIRLSELIRQEFDDIISSKTGWGKNEIMRALDQAIARATAKLLDEVQSE